jgi:UDP-hydrolysing UDP-N-acetyl-D-glucosamine 2-epimerase
LLAAIAGFRDLRFIFTKPNADANGRIIIKLIDDYVNNNPNQSIAFVSLGQKRYLSALAHAEMVIGNSSSGLIEVPSFGIPTVNIGDRQKGREKSASVIDCQNDTQAIDQAIRKALSSDFKEFSQTVVQVYGNGQTTEQIMQILKTRPFPEVLKKTFYDL